MIRQIKGMGISPLVDIRNCWKDKETTKQYKDTDIVYNYKGEVFMCLCRISGYARLLSSKQCENFKLKE